jgi:serine-type D-Ala-D-Ala carboxypeptidase
MKSNLKVKSVNWSRVDEALFAAARPYSQNATVAADKVSAIVPGAVLLVGRGGDVLYCQAFGCRSVVPDVTPMTEDMVFDIASLTKPIVTATLAMQLVDKGLIDIDHRLSHVFQTFGTYGKERMTIRHLLAHCSGYAANAPYYRQLIKANKAERTGFMGSRGAVEAVYSEIFRAKIEHLPGKVTKYSDLGYILLGDALEVVTGTYLDKLSRQNIFKPLKMQSTGYIDLKTIKRYGLEPVIGKIAPTAYCSWRGRVLCGEVLDDNAWAMGGVSAHAGLFSNVEDLHLLATELVDCFHGRGSLVSANVLRKFWRRDETVPGSSWTLGWETPAAQHSSCGQHFSDMSVGHVGSTGCSLWIDPIREVDVVLLSNHVHWSTDSRAMQTLRPFIHDLVMEALGFA